jgi:hypothetical protein
MTPRIPSLPDLIARFLRADFSFEQATPLFGEVAADNANFAQFGLLGYSNVARAQLEKLTLPEKGTVLVGIVIEFVQPVVIDFADLVRRYGPEEEGPRVKPTQPHSYTFQLRGPDFGGMLILDVPGGSTAARRNVSSLILRRFLPEMYQRRAPLKKDR